MIRYAKIKAIQYELPEKILSNADLAVEYPAWSIDKIYNKTGISNRHIVDDSECASDLAVRACNKIFFESEIERSEVDFIILCTQSPDFFLPATACTLQDRLGLPTTCGAFDFNQGCSGFIYGLGIAKGLIETGQARNILLVTAETYSRYIHPGDKSVRTLFGDAAAATLITSVETDMPGLDRFHYGTDGSGAKNLIVPVGASRNPLKPGRRIEEKSDECGNTRTDANLYMNGSAIFEFSMTRVPAIFEALFDEELNRDEIDLFAFHQANSFMLEALRKRLKLPKEKFITEFEHCGNTVSSSIPIALKEAQNKGLLGAGDKVAAVGFGVGYSWGSCIINW